MPNQDPQPYDLAGQVIGCAMEVHRELGHGFNEKVYHNALAIELRSKGFVAELEKKILVTYKGQNVGSFYADIMVNQELAVELKALTALNDLHEAQLVNYLTGTNQEEGLLLNFGNTSLQFKRSLKPSNLAHHPNSNIKDNKLKFC